MIEVFKTNVNEDGEADGIITRLLHVLPGASINFDLKDCDKVLRVESREQNFNIQHIIEIVQNVGFQCEVLE